MEPGAHWLFSKLLDSPVFTSDSTEFTGVHCSPVYIGTSDTSSGLYHIEPSFQPPSPF